MKILELFSGTESFSKVARARGHEVFTVDNNPKFKPDLCIDIMDLTPGMITGLFEEPDVIWASPPCTNFSIATHRHWENRVPKKETKESIKLIGHTINLILNLFPKYWILENPRGRLRFILGKPATTVYYGAYGHSVLKPTDFWGYFPNIKFRKKPKKKLGKWSYDIQRDAKNRAVVPAKLCEEIIIELEKQTKRKCSPHK